MKTVVKKLNDLQSFNAQTVTLSNQSNEHISFTVSYHGCDASGDSVSIFSRAVDQNGEGGYEYSPFGVRTTMDEQPLAETNPFRFSNEYFDDDLKKVIFKYRVYDPSLGKFLSRDPIEEQGGLNLYGIGGNDLINHWDEFGLKDPVGQWLRNKYVLRAGLASSIPFNLLNRFVDSYILNAAARGWDKYMNEDTHTVQENIVRRFLSKNRNSLAWYKKKYSLLINESIMNEEYADIFKRPPITDKYDHNFSSWNDARFWLGRAKSISVFGTIDICYSSSSTEYEIIDFDLDWKWFDTIDANPKEVDSGIIEGKILPQTERLLGNAYDVNILWKNSKEQELKYKYTDILGLGSR